MVGPDGRTIPQRQIVEIDYTNWRGERAVRRIHPVRIVFTSTRHHPVEQWILNAVDVDKGERRAFAMVSIHSWKPVADGRAAPIEGRT